MCMWYTFRVQSNVESQSQWVHAQRERFVTDQATYTLAGPPELRWGNLKGMSAFKSMAACDMGKCGTAW